MALTGKSCATALDIFKEVLGVKTIQVKEYSDKTKLLTGIMLVSDKVQDGYESLCINIEDMNNHQMEIFWRRKNEIPNTFIFTAIAEDVIRIGWF